MIKEFITIRKGWLFLIVNKIAANLLFEPSEAK